MSAPNSNDNQASMLGGHAQYAKGYVEETVPLLPFSVCMFSSTDETQVGNITGSKEWQASGKKDAEAGIGEMKVRFSRY